MNSQFHKCHSVKLSENTFWRKVINLEIYQQLFNDRDIRLMWKSYGFGFWYSSMNALPAKLFVNWKVPSWLQILFSLQFSLYWSVIIRGIQEHSSFTRIIFSYDRQQFLRTENSRITFNNRYLFSDEHNEIEVDAQHGENAENDDERRDLTASNSQPRNFRWFVKCYLRTYC